MENQRNREYVIAAVAENLFAGVGAGVLAWVAFRVYAGNAPDWIWDWARLVGLAVFGLLCLIRFSKDEVGKVALRIQYERAISMIAELEATAAEQRAEIQRLTKALRTREFADASKDAKEVVKPDQFAALRANVAQIVDRWINGVSFSRDACTMSKGEWEEAMRFLRDAGLLVRGGSGGRQWVFVDGVNQRQVERTIRERFDKLESHVNTNFVVA